MKRFLFLFFSLLLVCMYVPHASVTTYAQSQTVKVQTKKADGKITSVDSATGSLSITAKEKTIELSIDSTAILKVSGIKNPSLSDIWVGDKASVSYVEVNGVNTVKILSLSKQKGALKGVVEAIDLEARTLTVSGKTAALTDQTAIRLDRASLSLENIVVGDKIEISGFMKDGVLQASTVAVKRKTSVIKGEVTLISEAGESITISKKQVNITDQTKVYVNKEEATLADIFTGDKASVSASSIGNELFANAIQITRKPVEIKGIIETVDLEGGSIIIDGKTLLIDDETEIESDDENADIAVLVEGMEAEAKALRVGESDWAVLKLEVKLPEEKEDDEDKDDDDDKDYDEDKDDGDKDDEDKDGGDGEKVRNGEVSGRIESIDPAAMKLTVKGTEVTVTESTLIIGKKDKKLTLEQIPVGTKVEVKGIQSAEKLLIATKIKVEL
ncbi:DUF5666 domain-containing protein [Brevibacillus migulae]|uniref:DUF5666 domain-containing protein n=1 Tax=Brevibacillus migulae TaxID=1644114 RepID=UPI00106E969C|nr:DUF5666 domain-containing protein [Brevibacillus migulae]